MTELSNFSHFVIGTFTWFCLMFSVSVLKSLPTTQISVSLDNLFEPHKNYNCFLFAENIFGYYLEELNKWHFMGIIYASVSVDTFFALR